MTGNVCSVACCKNTTRKPKDPSITRLKFFSFPKDESLRTIWAQKCRRKDEFNYKTAKVCSQHFTPDDFEDTLKARLMNEVPKKLKSTSVPTINLFRKRTDENVISVQVKKTNYRKTKNSSKTTEELSLVSNSQTDENMVSISIQEVCSPKSNSEILNTQGIYSFNPIYYLELPGETDKSLVSTPLQTVQSKNNEKLKNENPGITLLPNQSIQDQEIILQISERNDDEVSNSSLSSLSSFKNQPYKSKVASQKERAHSKKLKKINSKIVNASSNTIQGVYSLNPGYYVILPKKTNGSLISTQEPVPDCQNKEKINNILSSSTSQVQGISSLSSLPRNEQEAPRTISDEIKIEIIDSSSEDENLISTPEEEPHCKALQTTNNGLISTASATQGVYSFNPGLYHYLILPNKTNENLVSTQEPELNIQNSGEIHNILNTSSRSNIQGDSSLNLLPSQTNVNMASTKKRRVQCTNLQTAQEGVHNNKRQKLVKEVQRRSSNMRDTFKVNEERIPVTCNEENYKALRKKYDDILLENRNLKTKLRLSDKLLLEKNLEFEQFTKLRTDEAIKDILSEFLTSNQLNCVLKKKKRVCWTTEEISKAFTLRYFSKQAYKYVRQTLKYPLPGVSTMQRWAANISLKNGLLTDVLNIMNTVGKLKDDLKRLTVLSFGKMKICSTYEYDKKDNKVVGPHNYIQVVMCRGLFDNWKQPIFVGFDRKMTKSLLREIITHLYNINYHVVACVSDCGVSSVSLWKELEISPSKTFCYHPVTEEKIYFFVDVNHTLKLIRNGFLAKGFTIDGKVISKEPLQELLKLANPDIASSHKLSALLINCEKKYRQNISLAKQLLSHKTANALRCYTPGKDAALCTQLADFIDLVNKWFTVMNSSTSNTQIDLKKPYGECLNLQDEILNEVKYEFSDLECISKPTMQNFQKGVIISTCSLQIMFESLKQKYKISNILSCRLNHYCLESLFSKLRTTNVTADTNDTTANDHPAPLLALYRLKNILMGKDLDAESFEQDEFIVTAALKRADVSESADVLDNSVEELTFPPTVEVEHSTSAMECIQDELIYVA